MTREIITHKEARARGLKRYFSGKKCPKGHVAERLVSTAGCCECLDEIAKSEERKQYQRDYVAANAERLRAAGRAYHHANRESELKRLRAYYHKKKAERNK